MHFFHPSTSSTTSHASYILVERRAWQLKSLVVTNCETDIHIAVQQDDLANRNEHWGKTYASQHTIPFARKNEKRL